MIARLLTGERQVLALGGGAFMDPETRALVRAQGFSIWLRAELDVLLRRTSTPGKRPLLAGGDPRATLATLLAQRAPVYAEADLVVDSGKGPIHAVVARILEALPAAAGPQARHDRRHAASGSSLGARSYEIVVGPGLLGARRRRAAAGCFASRTVIVVTDAHLAADRASAARWKRASAAAGIATRRIVLPAGEATKSMAELERLLDQILALGIERRTTLVAFGGGVIGDLAGFAAAILLRGLDYVQVPTSLLAQVDSAVGGKTGINARHGKNLIGSFHQPRLVLADTDVLKSLPARELRAGYAEVVKYGLIDQPEFFAWLERQAPPCWPATARPAAGDRGQLPRQGGPGRGRRARGRRARAAQSRPHLRPRAGSARGLWRRAAARRGGGARHRAGGDALGPARALPGGRRARASATISRRSACRPRARALPAPVPLGRRHARRHGARQEGPGRPAPLRAAARHRPGVRRRRGRARGAHGSAQCARTLIGTPPPAGRSGRRRRPAA